MELMVECKACGQDQDVTLTSDAAPPRCAACGVEADAEAWAALAAALAPAAAAMATLREVFRFEVVLATDDLPPPHGFDEAYTLAEERDPPAPSGAL